MTDKQSHTPGPWEWVERSDFVNGSFLTLESESGRIARGRGAEYGDEGIEVHNPADADLIAAAPELLNESEYLLKALFVLRRQDAFIRLSGHHQGILVRAETDLRAAIVKARGESSE